MGFYAVWLLQVAFWWGVFFKRHDLIGFISLDQRDREGSGLGLGSSRSSDGGRSALGMALTGSMVYMGARLGGRALRRAVTAPVSGIRRARLSGLERNAAHSRAMGEHEYERRKAAGVEAAHRVVDDEALRETGARGHRMEMQARTRALEEDKGKYAAERARLSERKRPLEGRATALRNRNEKLGQQIGQFEEGIRRIDAALARPNTRQSTRDRLLELRKRGQRKLDGYTTERDRNANALGEVNRGIAGYDTRINALSGQIRTAERGIDRWKPEIAEADKKLSWLEADRRSDRSRAAHRTVDRWSSDFAGKEFVPDAPKVGRDEAPMPRRESRDIARRAGDDGTFEMLATRMDGYATDASRAAKYDRKKRKLERARRGGGRW
jgi:hypothetical protein